MLDHLATVAKAPSGGPARSRQLATYDDTQYLTQMLLLHAGSREQIDHCLRPQSERRLLDDFGTVAKTPSGGPARRLLTTSERGEGGRNNSTRCSGSGHPLPTRRKAPLPKKLKRKLSKVFFQAKAQQQRRVQRDGQYFRRESADWLRRRCFLDHLATVAKAPSDGPARSLFAPADGAQYLTHMVLLRVRSREH